MKITVLGNNSTVATAGGACSSYLLEADGKKIILDMGNGSIFNLKKAAKLADIDAIILSHHHFDHFADIMLFRYEREGRKFMGEDIQPIDLYTPKMPDWLFENLHKNGLFNFHFIEEDKTVMIGEIIIDFKRVLHVLETYAMRITSGDKVFTYSADTGLCQGILDAAKDADLFICEASYGSFESYTIKHHLSGREAGEVAKTASVKKLLLTHLPEERVDELLEEAKNEFEQTELSEIMKTYEI